MNQAQPALFYICPLLLIVNFLLALWRKEFKLMWSGDMVRQKNFFFIFIKDFSTKLTIQNHELLIHKILSLFKLSKLESILRILIYLKSFLVL